MNQVSQMTARRIPTRDCTKSILPVLYSKLALLSLRDNVLTPFHFKYRSMVLSVVLLASIQAALITCTRIVTRLESSSFCTMVIFAMPPISLPSFPVSNRTEIYNLGAMSHVKVSFDMPEYTADCDGVGVLRMLDAIRASGLEKQVRFYQASTSELYGKVQEVPQSETTPFYPRSPYAGEFFVVVNFSLAILILCSHYYFYFTCSRQTVCLLDSRQLS